MVAVTTRWRRTHPGCLGFFADGSVKSMDKSERDSLIDDLWEMHGKLELWGSARMDAADREELADARQLIRNVLDRQLGINYLESRPFKPK
jgi:hypothetical protein